MTKTPEQRAKRLMSKGHIASVQLILNDHGVSAIAKPTSFHPLVQSRRELAYSTEGTTMTMTRATEITEATMGPVGRGHGKDIGAALDALEADLKRLDPR